MVNLTMGRCGASHVKSLQVLSVGLRPQRKAYAVEAWYIQERKYPLHPCIRKHIDCAVATTCHKERSFQIYLLICPGWGASCVNCYMAFITVRDAEGCFPRVLQGHFGLVCHVLYKCSVECINWPSSCSLYTQKSCASDLSHIALPKTVGRHSQFFVTAHVRAYVVSQPGVVLWHVILCCHNIFLPKSESPEIWIANIWLSWNPKINHDSVMKRHEITQMQSDITNHDSVIKRHEITQMW